MTTYDYSNGKIYTIRSHQTNKYYIGSTRMKTLAQRLGNHRLTYKRHLDGSNDYTSSFQILQYSDHYIELLENYPCESQEQLRKREGEFIRQYKSEIVNINIAGRTQLEHYNDNIEHFKEYKKQNYLNNRQVIIERVKQFYNNNKEARALYIKEYRELNKEALAEQSKQRYEANKVAISEKAKETFTCECGLTLTKTHKLKHNKTKKHLNYIQQQTPATITEL